MDQTNSNTLPPSPMIKNLSWGKVLLTDKTVYQDVKLYPGGAREWDWKETGTAHDPGIQRSDVIELIDNGAKIIILSKGVLKRLNVCQNTIAYLKEQHIEYEVLQSEDAAKRYNMLAREGRPVGALIHSTC